MKITVSYHHANLLIVLVGLIFFLYIVSKKLAKRRVITFGNFEVLEKVTGKKMITPDIFPMILRILAFVLIIVSISDPKLTYIKYASDVDYVFAIDTSSSMLTPDFFPSRLEVAKDVSLEFIRKLKNARIGVVTFAGKSYVKTELTNDISVLESVINSINIETPGGTAIGDALITSTSLLASSDVDKSRNKTVILITDGKNNIGVPVNETIESLNVNEIKVFTIGIGENVSVMNVTLPPELENVNATVAEFPILDEKTLMYIANQTGGKYFRVTDVESFKRALEATVQRKQVVIQPTFYLLLAACFTLLVEWALEATKYRILP